MNIKLVEYNENTGKLCWKYYENETDMKMDNPNQVIYGPMKDKDKIKRFETSKTYNILST